MKEIGLLEIGSEVLVIVDLCDHGVVINQDQRNLIGE